MCVRERVCVCCDVMCLTPVLSGRKGCQQANLSRWLSEALGLARPSHLVKVFAPSQHSFHRLSPFLQSCNLSQVTTSA